MSERITELMLQAEACLAHDCRIEAACCYQEAALLVVNDPWLKGELDDLRDDVLRSLCGVAVKKATVQ